MGPEKPPWEWSIKYVPVLLLYYQVRTSDLMSIEDGSKVQVTFHRSLVTEPLLIINVNLIMPKSDVKA